MTNFILPQLHQGLDRFGNKLEINQNRSHYDRLVRLWSLERDNWPKINTLKENPFTRLSAKVKYNQLQRSKKMNF